MSTTPERPIWRPYTQEQTAHPPLRIHSANGAYLRSVEGQEIFDGISSWWVLTHGHCHPAIQEALIRQTEQLHQVIFANFSHEPAEELAELLVRATPPSLTRVFFSDNGSTAVESALKMSLQACAQAGRPEKNKFLAFAHAYHGDTAGAMSVSAFGTFTRPYKDSLFPILRAEQPSHSSATPEEFVADFRRLIELHHTELAAVIVEPLIQGAAGMIVWPEESLQAIASLCQRWGVYLIFDEVMTGFGRTGTLFALQKCGIVPDLLCLSKGLTGGTLPLAVTLASEEIYSRFLSPQKAKMFFHGHSFTGNPLSCAAAVANFKVFDQERTLEKVATIENFQRQKLADLATRLPVKDVRKCGVMGALELHFPQASYISDFSEALTLAALQEGVFLRPLGPVVYSLPPYCSTLADLERFWDVVERNVTRLFPNV